MHGELTDWVNPFGLEGFRVDSASVLVRFRGRARVKDSVRVRSITVRVWVLVWVMLKVNVRSV